MFLLFFVSCQKNIEIDGNSIGKKFKGQLGTIIPETATDIAKNFIKMYYGNLENREIEEQETVAENGLPLFYIFNYKNGGFLILSAENGEMPILATGLENKFPLKGEINPGVGIWLTDTRDRIDALRTGKTPPIDYAAKMWYDLKNHTYKSTFTVINPRDLNIIEPRRIAPDNPDCSILPYTTVQINPLLTTTWGQGCGYNDFTPTFANRFYCDHAPTGCVATATAQIMKFHNFPIISAFNFSSMSLTSGSTSTASLMRTIGINIGMSYRVDASAAYTSRVEPFLESFGYSTDINYGSYNSSTLEQNINWSRPAILRGCSSNSCFLLWCWGTEYCHSWIGDGYIKTTDPCYGSYIRFHMNWGWDGVDNGYYYNPDPIHGSNYQYDRSMLYNIHH
jgi:hypothetical protein